MCKLANIYLVQFFQGFTNDPDICSNMDQFSVYVYCESIEATFSIHMKNDGVKNQGYGTKAEILALD